MTVAAHEIAAVLRDRLPGLPLKKLHKMLYYCQGHHLAATGNPLFADTISAWDMGPVVGSLWYHERNEGSLPSEAMTLNEAQFNTVGYVVSRYGGLTGLDLKHLTHAEDPWKRANRHRQPGASVRIELDWMTDYFAAAATDDEDETILDPVSVAHWLEDAARRRAETLQPDNYEGLRRRMYAC